MSGESRRVRALREARASMIAARERLLKAVSGRSDAELLAPPKDGGWSAVEVLDHLRTAEGQVVKNLGKLERGEKTKIPRRAWFYRLPISPVFWPIKVPAPKPVRPRPIADLEPKEVLGQMAKSRSELLAIADRIGEERFAIFVMPHFLLGRFTGLTWFQFVSGHENKHAGQIERVLSAR